MVHACCQPSCVFRLFLIPITNDIKTTELELLLELIDFGFLWQSVPLFLIFRDDILQVGTTAAANRAVRLLFSNFLCVVIRVPFSLFL